MLISFFFILLLIQFQPDQGEDIKNLPRRQLVRHARDEISWPEGKKAHNRAESLKFEEHHAKEELHRLEYIESKKLPTLQARASRVGNSKKDRLKLEKNQKLMGEIEHALFVEQRDAHLRKKSKKDAGLVAFFPEIHLDEEAAKYSAMRGSRKKNNFPQQQEENKKEKIQRRQAHQNLLNRNRGNTEDDVGGGMAPLGKFAKPARRKRREEHLARVGNAQTLASHTPREIELRRKEDAHIRQLQRLEKALSLEIDLESLLLPSSSSSSHGDQYRWISKLPEVSRLAWGLPLVVIHINVCGGEVSLAIEKEILKQKNQGQSQIEEDILWTHRRIAIEKWEEAAEALHRLLKSLSAVQYYGDMVDLHIHLRLPPPSQSLQVLEEESMPGSFFQGSKSRDTSTEPMFLEGQKVSRESVGLVGIANEFVWPNGRKNVTVWDTPDQFQDQYQSFEKIPSSVKDIDPLSYFSQWDPVDGSNELGVFMDGLRDEVGPLFYAWIKAAILSLNYDERQEDSIKFEKSDHFTSHGARLVGLDLGPPRFNESGQYYLHQHALLGNSHAIWGDVWWELKLYANLRKSLQYELRVQFTNSKGDGFNGLKVRTPSNNIEEQPMSWECLLTEFLTAHNFFVLHGNFPHRSTLCLKHPSITTKKEGVSLSSLLSVEWPDYENLSTDHPLFPDLSKITRVDYIGQPIYMWTNNETARGNRSIAPADKRIFVKWKSVDVDLWTANTGFVRECTEGHEDITKLRYLDLFKSISACLRRVSRKINW